MKTLHLIAFSLIIIGGLNWLLVGLFNKDLFVMLNMGMTDTLPKVVYILVGLAAISELLTHKWNCRRCTEHSDGMAKPSM